ncbi:unnamed protein product [Lymnaea stagnalis]|uniref:Uncharacterized protein n=1 Tax=Lymnaea stagnalis TaxID=6523 RepID=A0AAV2HTG0_LYMST
MVPVLWVCLSATLRLGFGGSPALTFQITSIDIHFESDFAEQFLSCLCDTPPTDCTLYGERLEDLKTYRILAVQTTMRRATEVSPVHNCAVIFGKKDVAVRCTKITQRIYHGDACLAVRHRSGKGRCHNFVGIVWNSIEYSVVRDDSVFEVLPCREAFNAERMRSQLARSEMMDNAVLIASIFLGVMFLVMFLAIQYMKPKSYRPARHA